MAYSFQYCPGILVTIDQAGLFPVDERILRWKMANKPPFYKCRKVQGALAHSTIHLLLQQVGIGRICYF